VAIWGDTATSFNRCLSEPLIPVPVVADRPTYPAIGGHGSYDLAEVRGLSHHMAERVCRWHPIEPELTHFHDIISLTFDIGTDRGTSDTYRPFVERPHGAALGPGSEPC
jgi:hypothetical protein